MEGRRVRTGGGYTNFWMRARGERRWEITRREEDDDMPYQSLNPYSVLVSFLVLSHPSLPPSPSS
jgi:hypothetical protein